MAGTIGNDRALGRLLGLLYTEVFQKRPRNLNKPLNRSAHLTEDQPLSEEFKTFFKDSTETYVYGPDFGHSADVSGVAGASAARWGESGTWA